jgi:hypothetical protein
METTTDNASWQDVSFTVSDSMLEEEKQAMEEYHALVTRSKVNELMTMLSSVGFDN